MTQRDLEKVADCGITRNEIDGQSTKFLHHLYKRKSSGSSEQNSNVNNKKSQQTSMSSLGNPDY